jgi:predicted ribosome quality control (RQC) complex YloA/Tae2 family protein
MDDESIKAIVAEIEPLLAGRAPGKIFQVGPLSLVIDFRLRDGYLFTSVEPGLPRLYLIKRRVRDLEKQSSASNQFALAVRKELSNTTLRSIEKDVRDRIVRFRFAGKDELEQPKERTLIAQLTGRSANLFLLDSHGTITHQLRPVRGTGQQIGEEYRLSGGGETRVRERGISPTRGPQTGETRVRERGTSPTRGPQTGSPAGVGAVREGSAGEPLESFLAGQFDSLSAALDVHYNALMNAQAFDASASAVRAELRKKISRQQRLLKQLQTDLKSHADAEEQKRLGDLLLANLSTARRRRNRVELIDYFSADAPVIEIEMDEKLTLPQEAERRFARYSRSKRAVRQLNSRIAVVQSELAALDAQQAELEKIVAERDEASLERLMSEPVVAGSPREISSSISRGKSKHKPEKKIPGVRRYVSSDGFEILVGRTSRDNDNLTFKVARPNDLWLHAADYGGSHVVVRNSTRKDVPHRTIIEAAQLAAQFSQARKDPKVDVHYTQRKFVSKPRGSAPGLVRMSRFKNITVAPKEAGERKLR